MIQAEVIEKIKTDPWCSTTFLPKIVPLWTKVETYDGTGQVTDDNLIHLQKSWKDKQN